MALDAKDPGIFEQGKEELTKAPLGEGREQSITLFVAMNKAMN